jgi:hypothetical protein
MSVRTVDPEGPLPHEVDGMVVLRDAANEGQPADQWARLNYKEKAPRTGPSNAHKCFAKRRSSGRGRQQLPVLGQNDRVDRVHDAVGRNDIRLRDASPVDSHVR